jgi:hypothetical protein
VAQNRCVGALDGFDDTVGLFLPAHAELAVDAGDNQVEARENFFRITRQWQPR